MGIAMLTFTRRTQAILGVLFISLFLFVFSSFPSDTVLLSTSPTASPAGLEKAIAAGLEYFVEYPLQGPAISERAARTEVLRKWIELQGELPAGHYLLSAFNKAIARLYPFIEHPRREPLPFSKLQEQSRALPGGIVISSGKKTFRVAVHLINNLRLTLGSTLPIRIAYAGDSDLPYKYREALQSLGPDILCFNILDYFRDDITGLAHGTGWGFATKVFAALASPFQETILVDADAIFLQKPEVMMNFDSFRSTGSLHFRDRALRTQNPWKRNRTAWYHELTQHRVPSEQLLTSKIWNNESTEEGESAVVVLDKGRLHVLMGLLHVAWMNTLDVRKDLTYKRAYGDKESWWLGMELTGAPYAKEAHYAGVIGEKEPVKIDGAEHDMVCAISILHLDSDRRPLWFNGGLIENKYAKGEDSKDLKKNIEAWMGGYDGVWHELDMPPPRCMRDGEIHGLTDRERTTMEETLAKAAEYDKKFKDLL